MSEKTCVVCGKPIPENRTSNNVKYCSAKCGRQAEKEKRIGYITERSKRYNVNKKMIHKLYGYKCAICGWQISPDLITDTKGHYQHSHGNEMHHIIPVAEGGTEEIENIILLCPNHHKMADKGVLSREDLKQYLKTEEDLKRINDELQANNKCAESIAKLIFG